MNYKKLNLYFGWLVFFIATAVYFITIEDTVSLWDCGEYITTAYKLEVGHPPGAPLFMMLGRLFSFFADVKDVAVWINRVSALSSSFSILFMFWTITLLVKKMILIKKKVLSNGDQFAIFGSAIVGSLAYTFSDSFWFSAVEGEVYAMASLFTAIIFWAIMKWDEEMALIQNNQLSMEVYPNRWLLLIMFLLGLAIGVHLLGILVVPAIGYVLYFRHKQNTDLKGILLTGLISIVVLGFIQEGVIPGSISLASNFEVFFTNSIGLPFFTGTLFFFLVLVIACYLLIKRARKKGQPLLYNATMGLVMLLIGYGSFAMIVIRSNANTPLDENDPENLVTLKSYLKREQYGTAPIFYGPYWNSQESGGAFEQDGRWNASKDPSSWKNRSPFYLRRFVVTKGEEVLKAYRSETDAKKYVAKNGGSIEETYFMSNEDHREHVVPTYSQNTIFPRMFYSDEQSKIPGYISWSGYNASEDAGTEIGKDGNRLPTFSENLSYFFSYQVNWMYWRYFMWNFAGRQNDIQGHGDNMRGNWITGISAIDNLRLGDQENAPYYTLENKANNKFFLLPLILGFIGLFIHIYRSPKDAFVVFLAFFFTGVAIVVYLNQKTMEPRERDYAFAGSFYFFAMWIGLGVYGLYEAFTSLIKKDYLQLTKVAGAIALLTLFFDFSASTQGYPVTITWIVISGGGIGLMLLMTGLKKALSQESQGAIVASLLAFSVPLIMGMQGWDDHDRSNKTSAHDLAYNYLSSCAKNGILFTGGDNDTFPLWYMQEVEGMGTNVRVCNLSLMQTDWYTDQMKMKAYDSDPLPIKFTEDQILMYAGYTDQTLFAGLFELFSMRPSDRILKEVIKMRIKHNRSEAEAAVNDFMSKMTPIVANITTEQANIAARVEALKKDLTSNTKSTLEENIYAKYSAIFELFGAYQSQMIKMPESDISQVQTLASKLEENWDYANIDDIMEFTRNDENLIYYNEQMKTRFFPATGFILPVDADNAVKSGLIESKDKKNCLKEIRFDFKDQRALMREQMMILDILANNDWKRGIYFSSPGGAEVALAFYRKGHIKQNGMVFELSPLKTLNERCVEDKMYANLMKNYHYGDCKNPKVLTDYYARRQTSQFRNQFSTLAQELLNKVDEIEEAKMRGTSYISQLKASPDQRAKDEAERLENLLKNSANIEKESKSKAISLIKRSLEVMPVETVIDFGEPRESGKKYNVGSAQVNAFGDGALTEYVGILYTAGDKKTGTELATKLATQIESIFRYYENSDAIYAAREGNSEDLYAALDNYLTIMMAVNEFDKNSPLLGRMKGKVNTLFNSTFKKIYSELQQVANEDTDGTGYAATLAKFKQNIDAIGINYGIIKDTSAPAVAPSTEGMDIQQLMNSQAAGDSVLK